MKKMFLIVALLGLVTLGAFAATYPVWDINKDGKCDMTDIGLVASFFSHSAAKDPLWTVPTKVKDPITNEYTVAACNCDINPVYDDEGNLVGYGDGAVDMKDIGFVARHFGQVD